MLCKSSKKIRRGNVEIKQNTDQKERVPRGTLSFWSKCGDDFATLLLVTLRSLMNASIQRLCSLGALLPIKDWSGVLTATPTKRKEYQGTPTIKQVGVPWHFC